MTAVTNGLPRATTMVPKKPPPPDPTRSGISSNKGKAKALPSPPTGVTQADLIARFGPPPISDDEEDSDNEPTLSPLPPNESK